MFICNCVNWPFKPVKFIEICSLWATWAASWEKSPSIVFGISVYGNNVKNCAGRRGLSSDLTQWPTDPPETRKSRESDGNNDGNGLFKLTAQKLHFTVCDSY